MFTLRNRIPAIPLPVTSGDRTHLDMLMFTYQGKDPCIRCSFLYIPSTFTTISQVIIQEHNGRHRGTHQGASTAGISSWSPGLISPRTTLYTLCRSICCCASRLGTFGFSGSSRNKLELVRNLTQQSGIQFLLLKEQMQVKQNPGSDSCTTSTPRVL